MNPNEARSFAGKRVGRVRKRGWFGEMFKTKDLDKECDLKSTEDCDYEEVLEYMNKHHKDGSDGIDATDAAVSI